MSQEDLHHVWEHNHWAGQCGTFSAILAVADPNNTLPTASLPAQEIGVCPDDEDERGLCNETKECGSRAVGRLPHDALKVGVYDVVEHPLPITMASGNTVREGHC